MPMPEPLLFTPLAAPHARPESRVGATPMRRYAAERGSANHRHSMKADRYAVAPIPR